MRFFKAEIAWGTGLQYAVITLLQFGARLDNSPASQNLRLALGDAELESISETRLTAAPVDADSLGIS